MTTWNTWGTTKIKAATAARKSRLQPKPSVLVSAPITQEMIAQRAEEIWERKGRPTDMDMENWLEAEAELKAEVKG